MTRKQFHVSAVGSIIACLTICVASATELPDEADKAWAQIEIARKAMKTPPTKGQEIDAYKLALFQTSGTLADAAGAFAAKYPQHSKATEARQLRIRMLTFAASNPQKGGVREEELSKVLEGGLADKSLPEDERVLMFVTKRMYPLMKRIDSGDLIAVLQLQRATTDALLAAKNEFPRNALVFQSLLSSARSQPGEMAELIAHNLLADEHASAEVKKAAQEIVDGKKPYELGRPLNIKHTAVDGQEVDIAQLKGKVVLVNFWATWCLPCVAEIPTLRSAYSKFHESGFEIIGISFDQDREALIRLLKDEKLPWPQFFDGKGWNNTYGLAYGISSIPRMWLVGKDGNLADVNAQDGLEQKIEKLLKATP